LIDLVIFLTLCLLFIFLIINNLTGLFSRVLALEIRWRLDKLALKYQANKGIRKLLMWQDLILLCACCCAFFLMATNQSDYVWLVLLAICVSQIVGQIILSHILESLKAGELRD
jgi:hypothetical protein